MSKTVDERVVEMRFDNKQFESGVQTSLSTIDKLNKSLNLTGATKGLENVSDAAKNVNFSGLSGAVESVQVKFSALQVIATTALANITNSAVNAGKRLASSLSVDQITAGWSKYEQKTASVQTLMNSTGKSIDDINGYLEKLMWFSDETSYGFTDMTAALAQMTSSGGDIEKLIPMITGVANATAYAGKGANEFSRVIYNLNQSYGAGYLQLMDWKSVELAGVGSLQLKQTIIDTAVELGKIKEGQVTVANFAETLKDKWADTEVMEIAFGKFGEFSDAVREMVESGEVDTAAQAIEKLSGKYGELGEKAFKSAQEAKSFSEAIDATKDAVSSGWLRTFEIIFGNYEEAKGMWTDLANTLWDVFASGAEARNEMLEGWSDLGGRTAAIEAVKNAFHGLSSVVAPIKEAFRDIFPPMTAEKLLGFTEGIKNLTARFKIGEKTANNIKRTFKGLFAMIDIGIQAISAIAKGFGKLVGFVSPAGDGLLGFTAILGDSIVKFRDFIKSSDVFNKIIGIITTALGAAVNGVKNFISKIGNAFKGFADVDLSGLESFMEKVEIRFEPLTALGNFVEKVCNFIISIAKKLAPIAVGLGQIIGKVFGGLFEKISSFVQNSDFNTTLDLLNAGLLGGLLVSLKKFIGSMDDVKETITGFLDDVKGIVSNINGILGGVKDAVKSFTQDLKAKTLLKIAGAIAILTAALLVLSTIESDKLTASLGAISVLFIELFGSMAIFEKVANKKGFGSMAKIAIGMIGISVAVLILATAMKKIADLEWSEIGKGLTAIAALTAMMVASSAILGKTSGTMTKGMTGLIAMALAMRILVGAVKGLGEIDFAELTRGLVGVGVLLAEIKVFMKLTNDTKMGIGKGTGLVLLAASLAIIASAVKKFGELDSSALAKGLTAIGVVLGELIIFTKLTNQAKNVVSTATGLTIIAAAMLIFAKAIGNMGSLEWSEIGKGLVTMAGALALVVGAMKLLPTGTAVNGVGLVLVASSLLILGKALSNMGGMSWDEVGRALVTLATSLGIIAAAMALMHGALSGAAALLIISNSLVILSLALRSLGNMSWEEMGRSLLTLVGVFTVLGVSAVVLAPLTPVLLALGAAIVLLGVGCLAAGAGILAFSAGLSALAIAGTAGAAALVVVVSSIIGLIPMMIQKLGEGIVLFCNVIANSGKAICGALATVVTALLNAITASIPSLMTCVGTLLDALLNFIVEYIPKIVDAGMKLILGLLRGIESNLPLIIEAAADIIIAFLRGISTQSLRIVQAGFDIILDFINGLTKAIKTNTPKLISAIENLFTALKEAAILVLKRSVSGFKSIGKDMIQGLIQGVKDKFADVKNAAVNVISGAVSAVKNFLGIHSPSRVFAEIGEYSDEGLANGLKKFAGVASSAAKDVGKETVDSLKTPLSRISDIVNDNFVADPTIRPVIDLTDIQNGAAAVNGLFSNPKLSLAGTGINVRSINANTGNIAHSMSAQQSYTNNRDIVDALDKVREDITNLGEAMSNMKVVMDSGATVGSLETEIDKRMGTRTAYKERWI